MKTGDELEGTARRIAPGGAALVDAGPETPLVFAPYAAPGDRLRLKLTLAKKDFGRGVPVDVLEPGPGRRKPPCPLHFEPRKAESLWCGGCDFQHLNEKAQIEAKLEILRDAMRRLAKIENPPLRDFLVPERRDRYRNKAVFHVDTDEYGEAVAGCFAPDSRTVVPLEDCLIQEENTVGLFRLALAHLQTLGGRPFSSRDRSGWLREILVRNDGHDGLLLGLVTANRNFPPVHEIIEPLRESYPGLRSLYQRVSPAGQETSKPGRWIHRWGERTLIEKIGNLEFEVGPGTFFQVNRESAKLFFSELLVAAQAPPRTEDLLDLYCGVGAIGLSLASRFRRVLGVEEDPSSVERAWKNAERNGIRNAAFAAAKVEAAARRELERSLDRPLTVVLDPPRAGCPRPVLEALARRNVRKIIYASCDPATLGRDSGILKRNGFDLQWIRPVEMFPQTSHLETVSLWTRIDAISEKTLPQKKRQSSKKPQP